MQERDLGSIPGWGRSPGEMATHSSTLVWEIPWTEEPGDIQFRKLERVGHERAASTLYLYFGYACVLRLKTLCAKTHRKLVTLERLTVD